MAEREANATVATPTEVFVVGSGDDRLREPVFRADHVENLAIRWAADQSLVIEADRARI